MNIEPIKMTTWDARRAMREYSQSVRRMRAERLAQVETDLARARLKKTAIELEDEALRVAYSAIARGKSVININTAMRAAGLDPKTRLPKLGLVRADSKRVDITTERGCLKFYSSGHWYGDKNTMIPLNVFNGGADLTNYQWRRTNNFPSIEGVHALAPQIPPRHRPEPDKLADMYLLFEANWQVRPPDPDPFLLKALGGGFFVIVAKWDMTPLEQSILEGRIG